MRLRLYSSRRGQSAANLVAIQSEDLDMLPTVLVCPLQAGFPLTSLRVEVEVAGHRLVVRCELARPINRRALTLAGELPERDSRRGLETFRRLLAQ